MQKFKIIYATGASEMLKETPTLEEMQLTVGGYIEAVEVDGGTVWVNEDGIRLGLPRNEFASVLAGRTIVGAAIFEWTVKGVCLL
jgi:hypothetical protein